MKKNLRIPNVNHIRVKRTRAGKKVTVRSDALYPLSKTDLIVDELLIESPDDVFINSRDETVFLFKDGITCDLLDDFDGMNLVCRRRK